MEQDNRMTAPADHLLCCMGFILNTLFLADGTWVGLWTGGKNILVSLLEFLCGPDVKRDGSVLRKTGWPAVERKKGMVEAWIQVQQGG
jgi:hypothetical protein